MSTIHRAWTLISCNRNDDKAFDVLNERFRNLCELGEDCAAHLYVPVYGQYDMVLGLEWKGSQRRLVEAIQHIERCGEPQDASPSYIYSTTTYTVLDPQGSLVKDAASWKDAIPICIGAYVQPGQHEHVREKLVNALNYRGFSPHLVDMVLGEFDLFVVVNVTHEGIGQLEKIWSAMRSSTKILKTVTFFSHAIIDTLTAEYRARVANLQSGVVTKGGKKPAVKN